MVLIWVASLGRLHVNKRRVWVADEADSAFMRELLPGAPPASNAIFGLAEVLSPSAYDLMTIYTPSEREQLKLRTALAGPDVALGTMGCLFHFKVSRAIALPNVEPLVQCANRQLRGFVCSLEQGQPERLWAALPQDVRDRYPVGPPTAAVRLPSKHAVMVVRGSWEGIVLPHVPRRCDASGFGTSSLLIDWRLLHLQAPVPIVRDVVADSQLDVAMSLQIADALRKLASLLPADDPTHQAQLDSVVRMTGVMQSMHEQLDPMAFTKIFKAVQQKGHTDVAVRVVRSTRFNIVWLVQSMLMADLLKNSDSMRTVLKRSLRMLLPNVLQGPILTFIEEHKNMTPHKTTISRWRLLLDGAFMLYQRQRNHALLQTGDGYARYLMTDSSTQHRKQIQLSTVLSIKLSVIVDVYRDSVDLALQWPGAAG